MNNSCISFNDHKFSTFFIELINTNNMELINLCDNFLTLKINTSFVFFHLLTHFFRRWKWIIYLHYKKVRRMLGKSGYGNIVFTVFKVYRMLGYCWWYVVPNISILRSVLVSFIQNSRIVFCLMIYSNSTSVKCTLVLST